MNEDILSILSLEKEEDFPEDNYSKQEAVQIPQDFKLQLQLLEQEENFIDAKKVDSQ